jgi:hypothetical protein
MKKTNLVILVVVIVQLIAAGLIYFLSPMRFSDQLPKPSTSKQMDSVSIEQAIQAAHAWLTLPGVAGVGQGKTNEQDCIVVFLTGDTTGLAGQIPATFMGHPVTFQSLGGPVEAQ